MLCAERTMNLLIISSYLAPLLVSCGIKPTLFSEELMSLKISIILLISSLITTQRPKTKRELISFNLFVATIWSIWLERNKRLFRNSISNANNLWKDICNLTGLWLSKEKLFKNYSTSSIALNLEALYNI